MDDYKGKERRTGKDRRGSSCDYPKSNNITRIIEITGLLNQKTRFEIEKGKATVVNEFKRDGLFSATIIHQEKGTSFKFSATKKKEREWSMILSGDINLRTEAGRQTLKTGDMIEYTPGQEHAGVALADTEILFISIPKPIPVGENGKAAK